ncbi:MAG TPA: hypothetical protein GXZ37_02245 [Clostridiales bacterium]|nr:hypothetical protein [Clostridiales bacterium]
MVSAFAVSAEETYVSPDIKEIAKGTVGTDFSDNVQFGTGSAGADYYWAKFQKKEKPNFVKLGSFDMSKVYKIEFDMANDANSTFTENSFIRFSKDLEGTQVIAQTLATRANGWAKPVTVTIDNVKSDYNGDVYLSYVFSGTNDGVIIANIKFWQKAEATTEEPSTPSTETPSTEDTTQNPGTGDESNIIAAMALISGLAFVILKKKAYANI